jgi:hypothetical protein
MNRNSNNIEMTGTKMISRNPITRKYEEVFPEDEIVTGQTVVILHWSNALDKYVVIPGASYHTMTANGLVLQES